MTFLVINYKFVIPPLNFVVSVNVPLFRGNIIIFPTFANFPQWFSKIHVFLHTMCFSFSTYFDHAAFVHHTMHVLDAPEGEAKLRTILKLEIAWWSSIPRGPCLPFGFCRLVHPHWRFNLGTLWHLRVACDRYHYYTIPDSHCISMSLAVKAVVRCWSCRCYRRHDRHLDRSNTGESS